MFTMVIQATQKELENIGQEVLNLRRQTGENFEVEVVPPDEKFNEPPHYQSTTVLHLVAKYGNEKTAQYLVGSGYDVNVKNPYGFTPLMTALCYRKQKIVEMLLNANADIFCCDSIGVSAAKLALISGFMTLIMLKKIKASCGDDSEATAMKLLQLECPLTRAAFLRDISIVNYMLGKGRKVDEADRYDANRTALHYAVRHADPIMLDFLLDRGADVNRLDYDRQTPIFFYDTDSEDTAEKIEVLKALLDNGASLNAKAAVTGFTAVEQLICTGKRQTIRTLLPYVQDITGENRHGVPLLHLLLLNCNPGVIDEYRNEDWNFGVVDTSNRNTLWSASIGGNIEALEFLLSKGVDVNKVNKAGMNVLMGLTANATKAQKDCKDRLKCAEILLRHGANAEHVTYSFKDNQMKTIFEYIQESQDFALAKIVLAHLALMEEYARPVSGIISQSMSSVKKFQRYFELCKKWFDDVKKIVIHDELTLFEFFTGSEDNLRTRAGNPEFVSELERIMKSQGISIVHYSTTLQGQFEKVVKISNVKKMIYNFFSESYELSNNYYIIDKIAGFMN